MERFPVVKMTSSKRAIREALKDIYKRHDLAGSGVLIYKAEYSYKKGEWTFYAHEPKILKYK